jgi:hypothetical protein
MIKVQPVDVAYIHQTWPLVEPFIMSAFVEGYPYPEWGRLYSVDNIKDYIASGQWVLFVFVDVSNTILGAVTVAFSNHPLHRVAFVTAIGGRLVCNKDTMKQFKLLCKQRGATILQAYGRESTIRLWKRYNFEPRNTLVETLL